VPPEAVSLPTGLHGKPHCSGGPSFNLSHSDDQVVLALHPSRPVGVDVEALGAEDQQVSLA
jgi:4'-phosphopantetheinyl transferase